MHWWAEMSHDACQSFSNISRKPQAESKKMTQREQQGFTLIELMIVVAIIGIIASVAIPLYTNYSIRTQVSEGIHLSSGAKSAVAEYFQNYGVFATTNGSAGLEAGANIVGNYVTQLQLSVGGTIEVTYGNRAHTNITGAVLSITPTSTQGSVTWDCAGDALLPNKYLPDACRT
jgi:type IV pilus assembly protein PilA